MSGDGRAGRHIVGDTLSRAVGHRAFRRVVKPFCDCGGRGCCDGRGCCRGCRWDASMVDTVGGLEAGCDQARCTSRPRCTQLELRFFDWNIYGRGTNSRKTFR